MSDEVSVVDVKDKIWKIVTLGDSLTQGNPPPEFRDGNVGKYQYFLYTSLLESGFKVDIRNHGIGGQLMGQIVNRLEATLPADIIVIMGGTNDIWHYGHVEGIQDEIEEDLVEQLTRAVAIVRKNDGSSYLNKLVICSIPPFGANSDPGKTLTYLVNRFNKVIEDFCLENGVFFCDVNKAMRKDDDLKHARPENVIQDGVHFTPVGNEACGKQIARCCMELMKK
ncbi:MAG: SGNH/GDSL hydrolase family protein [Promethearchaeota archaeon]